MRDNGSLYPRTDGPIRRMWRGIYSRLVMDSQDWWDEGIEEFMLHYGARPTRVQR